MIAEQSNVPKRFSHVTQVHTTPDQPVIDFHGTKVTPGHVFLCPDGDFRQIGAILMADGYVVNAEGETVRARTKQVVSAESFVLHQSMFGRSGVAAFEIGSGLPTDAPPRIGALAAPDALPGQAEVAIGGLFASPSATLPGRATQSFDPYDYSRPAPDGYELPWAGRETVYNITVEGLHTYIAGDVSL